MPDAADSVERQLAKLRESFGAKLPERREEIVAAAGPLRRDDATADEAGRAVEELRALTHKLTGSAGTFGFTEVSQAARQVEQRCDRAVKAETEPRREDRDEILVLIDRLVDELGRGGAAAPEPAPAPPEGAIRGDPRRVLYFGPVPDDDKAGFAAQMRDFGFDVRHAPPEDAEAACSDGDVAAAIVDLDAAVGERPDDETCRRMAERGHRMIAVSDRGDFDSRLAAVRSGFALYIERPYEITVVVDAIDRLLLEREPDPFRVLVVDDDENLSKYVEVVLGGAGMIARAITDPFRVLDEIADFCPELILLDLNMPGCDGMELASVIRQQESLSSVSIAFLSSETDPSRQIEAMHTGGDDFLPKTLRSDKLVSAVEARAKRFRMIRSKLVSDSLTGLLNHTATRHRVETEIARARREDAPFCFALVDIDHFKAINDTYGHPAGDQVIRSLALLLKQRFRTTDVIGRVGGEEFGIGLVGAGREDALRVLDELRRKFAALRFRTTDGEFACTFSAGVALHPEYPNAKDLNDAADQALYTAKAAGRNRIVFAEAG